MAHDALNNIAKYFDSAKKGIVKVTRAAFLYLEPKGDEPDYAQCGTCMMWTGPKDRKCIIHGPDLEVHADDTCGLYVKGPVHKPGTMKAVTPLESGFERRKVRCENCHFGDVKNGICGLFAKLNKEQPKLFDLDEKIKPQGCCNANTPKDE